jgi:glutamine amidotransferase
MTRIAIIDYGVGNLRSVEKAFAAVGVKALVCSEEKMLLEAEALVLPGVGAFGKCMKELMARGFDQLVRNRAGEGTPILGVCVGMQMLFEQSEEFGRSTGLGLMQGRVRRFADSTLVPQVGWNQVSIRTHHPLMTNIADESFFYFVHSYYCEPSDPSVVIGETDYATRYPSVVAQKNIQGVQFHPEKSQTSGLKLLANFAGISRNDKC